MRTYERGRVSFFRAIQEMKKPLFFFFFFLSRALALPFFSPLLTLGAFTLIASPASPDLSFFMCACVVENGDVGRKKS